MFRKFFAAVLMVVFLFTASTPFYAQDKQVKKDTKVTTVKKTEKVTDKKEMSCCKKEEEKKAEKKSCCGGSEEKSCESKDAK